jgi:hypothetical protein
MATKIISNRYPKTRIGLITSPSFDFVVIFVVIIVSFIIELFVSFIAEEVLRKRRVNSKTFTLKFLDLFSVLYLTCGFGSLFDF